MDGLRFYTNTGRVSPYYGGYGGGTQMQYVPVGFRLAGIYGRSGARLDQIGFIFTKT